MSRNRVRQTFFTSEFRQKSHEKQTLGTVGYYEENEVDLVKFVPET